jgi:hypothetical protein
MITPEGKYYILSAGFHKIVITAIWTNVVLCFISPLVSRLENFSHEFEIICHIAITGFATLYGIAKIIRHYNEQ